MILLPSRFPISLTAGEIDTILSLLTIQYAYRQAICSLLCQKMENSQRFVISDTFQNICMYLESRNLREPKYYRFHFPTAQCCHGHGWHQRLARSGIDQEPMSSAGPIWQSLKPLIFDFFYDSCQVSFSTAASLLCDWLRRLVKVGELAPFL